MDNGKMVKVRHNRNAQVAVTRYQVLSSTLSSALVELQPITGESVTLPQWDHTTLCHQVLSGASFRAAGAMADLCENVLLVLI